MAWASLRGCNSCIFYCLLFRCELTRYYPAIGIWSPLAIALNPSLALFLIFKLWKKSENVGALCLLSYVVGVVFGYYGSIFTRFMLSAIDTVFPGSNFL